MDAKKDGDWVPTENPGNITLIFTGVSLFRAEERDKDIPYTEDDCLNQIGIVPTEERNTIGSVWATPDQFESFNMVLDFMSDATFKVYSESVRCEIT